MVSRQRAVGEFLISVAALSIQLYSWKSLKQHDEYDDPPALSVKGMVVGTVYQLIYHSAYDRDYGHIRSNKHRALTFGISSGLIQRRIFPDKDTQLSFSSGGLIGTILYRLWYGILHPVPGENNR